MISNPRDGIFNLHLTTIKDSYFLTFCTEARTGGKFGNVYNFHSKLFPRIFVKASPHKAEWASENIHENTMWKGDKNMTDLENKQPAPGKAVAEDSG